MKTIYDLIEKTKDMDANYAKDYLSNFFSEKNMDNYLYPAHLNDLEKDALDEMFLSNDDLTEKCLRIHQKQPLCVEAVLGLVRTYISDVEKEDLYKEIYSRCDDYENMSPYGQEAFLTLLNMYGDFYLNIGSLTKTIKVQTKIIDLSKRQDLSAYKKVAFLYNVTENADDFYDFYQKHSFPNSRCYLSLITCLLKNDDFQRAEDVLWEFVRFNPKAKYLTCFYDEEYAYDPDVQEFVKEISDCFDEMMAVPEFLRFCKGVLGDSKAFDA